MANPQPILEAVRAVGIVKPKFNPSIQTFDPPSLDIVGTGFWITDATRQVFVTCAHVIQAVDNSPIDHVGMLVIGGNKQPYVKATIGVVDHKHDLAILDVALPNGPGALKIVEREIVVSDKAAYAGFPLGKQLLNPNHSPTYAEGVIGSEVINEPKGISKIVQISGSVVGGYSGSPVVLVNDPTQVIGVISNHPSETQNIFRAIHWLHLKELIALANS